MLEFYPPVIPSRSRPEAVLPSKEKILLSIPDSVYTVGGKVQETERANLMLVALGEKPANIFSVSGNTMQKEFRSKVLSLEHVLQDMKLPFYALRQREYTQYAIGSSSEIVTRMLKAYKLDTYEDRITSIGKALGYPDTAVQAYVNYEVKGDEQALLTHDEVKQVISDPVLQKMITFRLSRDYWQDELEGVMRQEEILKKSAPEIYRRVEKM